MVRNTLEKSGGCSATALLRLSTVLVVSLGAQGTASSDSGHCFLSGMRVHSLGLGRSRAYLLETPRGMVLIDAGYPGYERRVMRALGRIGRSDLGLVVLTHAHFDHFGSAAALRKLTGAKVAVHRADSSALARGATELPCVRGWGRLGRRILPLAYRVMKPRAVQPDIVLIDGSRLDEYGVNARVVHTPGHTPGSCCIFTDDSLAFVGDLVSRGPFPFVQRYYAADWDAVRASIGLLKRLNPTRVFCGHGQRPVARKRLQRLRPPPFQCRAPRILPTDDQHPA